MSIQPDVRLAYYEFKITMNGNAINIFYITVWIRVGIERNQFQHEKPKTSVKPVGQLFFISSHCKEKKTTNVFCNQTWKYRNRSNQSSIFTFTSQQTTGEEKSLELISFISLLFSRFGGFNGLSSLLCFVSSGNEFFVRSQFYLRVESHINFSTFHFRCPLDRQ